jgi:hypothetical protein
LYGWHRHEDSTSSATRQRQSRHTELHVVAGICILLVPGARIAVHKPPHQVRTQLLFVPSRLVIIYAVEDNFQADGRGNWVDNVKQIINDLSPAFDVLRRENGCHFEAEWARGRDREVEPRSVIGVLRRWLDFWLPPPAHREFMHYEFEEGTQIGAVVFASETATEYVAIRP